MSESIEEIVMCADVRTLMQARKGRVAVLAVLIGNDPDNKTQFVTYGESATDKVESHQLKEFLKDAMCDGYVPAVVTHESFILDAAKVKQQRDELLDACKSILRAEADYQADEAAMYPNYLHAELPKLQAAVIKAEGAPCSVK